MFYLDRFHARRLGQPPTTGARSNWVVCPGARPWEAIAADLPRAIRVDGFLGGSANPATGDFSFGVLGAYLERGVAVSPIAEMNVSGNLLSLLPRLIELADDPYPWSSTRSPSLVFDEVAFSGR
jgi:PmbA protein